MPLSARVVRVPIRLVDGRWELLYGGPVRVRDGAVGDLHLDRAYFTDDRFLSALTQKRSVAVLPQGTELRIALTIRPELVPLAPAFSAVLLPRDATQHAHSRTLSVQSRFVSVVLGGPTDTQRRRTGAKTGGLSLWLEGTEPRYVDSGRIQLPAVIGGEPADSLNHAFTRLSEAFEPWRKAHTGSIYERVFYRESNGVWYPLKDLRAREMVSAEREVIQQLWENVKSEIGAAMF